MPLGKIRVLQVVTRLVRRGVGRHVLEIAAGLDRERYAVEILAGRSEPGEGSLWEEARERGISISRVNTLQRAVDPRADIAAFAAIYQKIRTGGYDIVHTHISKAGILGRLAAKCAGVPVILHTNHGRIEEVHDGSLKSHVLLGCERLAARITDAYVAVSEYTARFSLNSGIGEDQQYAVIHNGVDLAYFQDCGIEEELPAELADKTLLGAIGSLTPEKGFDVLLEACPKLMGRYPDLRLCILGDGLLGPSLQNMVQKLGLQSRVYFTGNLSDVRPWLSAFALVLLPSRSEGLPTVALEAMAMGRPVVASCVGGVPEVVVDGRTGLLVPPEDPGALATAIEMLLQDLPKRQEWSRAGRIWVEEEFSLGRMVQKLERLYEDLLKEKKVER